MGHPAAHGRPGSVRISFRPLTVRRRRVVALGLALATWTSPLASPLNAQTPSVPPSPTVPRDSVRDPAFERRVHEVAAMLRCPVCLNLSVADSPSELAQDMRNVVRERLSGGDTEQQVLAYFVQRYGEWVLMKPTTRGVNILVWVLPGVVILAGGALVLLAMQRWTRRSGAPAAAVIDEIPEEDLRKVREAMARERDLD
jgi:cytochrome c-type biogenesis protein CcmH